MNEQKHEEKRCPRCNNAFECKVGDIGHCQCAGKKFTEAEHAFVAEQFSDCLCLQCLIYLKHIHHQQNFTSKIKEKFEQR